MALWEGVFQDMDPLTLRTIVQMQLEDSEELAASAKGKQRAGTATDAEIALQMYQDDLRVCDATLTDRKMAQSIATAVLRDGDLIRQAYQQEQQLARDRELAQQLSAGHESAVRQKSHVPSKRKAEHERDVWSDDELLEKAAAIYMLKPGSVEALPLPVTLDSDWDSDDCTQAESSAWAGLRKQSDKPKMGHCIACGEDYDFFDVARVPCNHEYCRVCLATLFEMSMVDESLFPPRCDNKEIPLSQVRFFLPPKLAKHFEQKYVELNTKNRTYCHDPKCSAFIPGAAIDDGVGTCQRCSKTTCTICKAPSHSGDCPEDTALQQLIETAEAQQWQRCHSCKRIVELDYGCNHMNCRCGAQFCYICGAPWHTCTCEQWEEGRLLRRAAQIVDRIPGHRLFRPVRVAHTQPATRRPSVASNAATVDGPSAVGAALSVAGTQRGMRALSATSNAVTVSGPWASGAGLTLSRPISPEASVWQSDFSDHFEWEEDWPTRVDDDESTSSTPAPVTPGVAQLFERVSSDELAPRELRIAAAVEHLRENHACEHDKWRWVKGGHRCEECHNFLKQFIFECRHCQLQACNRCRRNRL